MRFISSFIVIATVLVGVHAGTAEVCTNNLDGSGGANYQVTKDCCAAVNQRAYFSEVEHKCEGYGGCGDNAVDTGAMVTCCSSRNAGSKEVGCG